MRIPQRSGYLALGALLIVFFTFSGLAQAASPWVNLTNSPGKHLDTCLLLTSGDVMCHEYGSHSWHRLRPDNTGSYKDGTWDSPGIADMPNGTDTSNVSGTTCSPCAYAPTYFASAVLPDGRVVVIGGEYNTNSNAVSPAKAVETNIGFMYDPATDSWSSQLTEPYGTGNVGDSPSVILQNGIMLIGNINSGQVAAYNPSTKTFTNVPAVVSKSDNNSEEGWTILPDGTFLTADAGIDKSFEIYDPVGKKWSSPAGGTIVSLGDVGGNCNSAEVGPAVTTPFGGPKGSIINFSGAPGGQNAVYDISAGTWSHTVAMDFGSDSNGQFAAADAPASLLPNGHVLVMSSPGCKQVATTPAVKYSVFNKPSHFYEWDGTNLTQLATDADNSASFISYQGRMLLLPTGEVLLTAFDQGSTDTIQLYTAGGSPMNAWRPVIDPGLPAVLGLGTTYTISGKHFNGFSEGAAYGDDAQMATNFPLVRITDSASHVFYAKTHDHSRMGVEAIDDNTTVVSTNFDVPSGMANGSASLVVVTNGIPSNPPVSLSIEPGSTLTYTGATTSDYADAATVSAVLKTLVGGTGIGGKTVTFKLGVGTGTETCSAVTDGSGIATCSITPFEASGSYTVSASFAGDSNYGASSAAVGFTITKEQTELSFTLDNPTSEDYHDATTVKAHLTTDGIDFPGRTVTFKLGAGTGTETCSATTDGTGIASCSITPNEAAGLYTLNANFATDAFYLASSASTGFTIKKEETTTKFTLGSATVIPVGHSATLSAILTEDLAPPIAGRSVTLTLGTGGGAQSCVGTTDVSGKAQCTIPTVAQPLGPNTVSANFLGDAFYLPSSDSEAVILFAFLDRGSMEIGDLNAPKGTSVTFWAAQWTSLNSLTGGSAPNSFKGFADVAPQTCGGSWTATPSNSPGPPPTVPSYMGVIASSTITKSGNTITGNVPYIVVIKTDPGYGADPGHAGTGTVVATYCHP